MTITRLVANAGLLLPATLARHLGLRELVDHHLDLGGAPGRANTGDKLMTLVASAMAGGDCIDDADVLRTGGTACTLGGTVKAPSTLRSFRWGHVRQLDRVSRELLARAWAAGAGPGDAPFTIDLDSTICETYGLAKGADHPDYLLRLSELELIDRHHRMVERRIKAARFPTTKSLDTFDFLSMPSLNEALVLELARCEYIERPHNVIALGNSGTGKTHIALGLGLAACQRGLSVGFTTAAALVHELIEARDERRLLNLQRRLARIKLLIIDELGFVPLSKTGAELLFEVFSQRYERGSVLVTSK